MIEFQEQGAIRLIELSPDSSEEEFERFIREEVFPHVAFMRHDVNSPGNVLLKSDQQADGRTRYLWLTISGIGTTHSILEHSVRVSIETTTKLASFGELVPFGTAIGVTPAQN